jgi:predicted nucleic acid-binding protein
MIVDADTGPLLALAKVDALDLLRQLYQPVITGPAVYTEAVTAGLAMNAADALALNEAYLRGELVVRQPGGVHLAHSGALHAGEVESIQLAIEQQADWLLIDDFDARQLAQQNFAMAGLAIGLKGTLGVVVTATHGQIVTPVQAIDLVKALKNRPDIWLSSDLCEAVIKTLQHL